MSDTDLLPEGLEDRLPREAATATRVLRTIADVLESHGYDRVAPPLVEFERSFAARMAGISTRRMVRFVDPVSLRMMALRADITPQIGRIAEMLLADAPRPLRLSYSGDVVAIRGDGLEPARQRVQCGAEIVGRDSVAAAAEVVAVAVEALQAAGARGVSVDFTLPDLVDTLAAGPLPLASDAVEAVRRELDAKDAGGIVDAGGAAYLPLLYATGAFAPAIERLAAFDAGGGALTSRIEALREIAGRLGDGVQVTLDPTERHGFEYQTWFGFTLFAEGSRSAVGRGGTYRISGQGDGEVATGFSLYPDALIASLAADEPARDAVFLPIGHDAAVAARLRGIGWRTVAALDAADEAGALGCTHRLEGDQPVSIEHENI